MSTTRMLCFTLLIALGCGTSDDDSSAGLPLAFDTVIIDNTIEGPAFTEIADINADGYEDIVLSTFGAIEGTQIRPGVVYVYYGNGTLNGFTRETLMSEREEIYWPNDAVIQDMDGDGDLDVVIGTGFLTCNFLERQTHLGAIEAPRPCGGLVWFEQTPQTWIRHDVIGPNAPLFYHKVLIDDLDGDGINDMIAVGEDRPPEGAAGDIAEAQFLKGTLPLGNFEAPKKFGNGLGSLPQLLDVDGDGDMDILSAEFFANRDTSFVWFERLEDQNGEMQWQRNVIDRDLGPSIQLSMVDNLFGNGQPIAVGSNHSNTTMDEPEPWESGIYAYIPELDIRAPWRQIKLSEHIVSRPIRNQAAPGIFGWGDVDLDGDIDLVVSGDGDSRLFVLEQTNPAVFTTWTLDEDMGQAGGMKVTDFNRDARPEIVATSFEQNVLQLYVLNPESGRLLEEATTPEWAQPMEGTSVQVNFDDGETGPLVLAIFDEYPPTGAPRAFLQVENPSSGDTHTLGFNEPGDFKLLAFIDSDGSGVMAVSDADPVAVIDLSLPAVQPMTVSLVRADTPTPMMDDPNLRTTVSVTVNYDGPQDAQLTVGSFKSLPVMNAPDVFQVIEAGQAFPITVTLENVPGSRCQILAFLARGGNPTFPGTSDPIAESMVIELNGSETEITLSLEDR